MKKLLIVSLLVFLGSIVRAQEPSDPLALDTGFGSLRGGLVLCFGGSDSTGIPPSVEASGRFVIHYLYADESAVAKHRNILRQRDVYGMAVAEVLPDPDGLPYAENLVNLVFVRSLAPSASELFRIVCPEGVAVIDPGMMSVEQLEAAGFQTRVDEAAAGRIFARKPWPKEMDSWTHPRHGADGNVVSTDTAVGPPERVRWIAAATSEVEGLVSAEGRNFYGGILARDSFNGLRLWHHDTGSGEMNADAFKLPRLQRDGARPIATGQFVFAVVKGKLTALHAASGEVHRTFSDIERPSALLQHRDVVVATDENRAHAFSVVTGEALWQFDAPGARHLVAGGELVSLVHGRPKRGEASKATVLDIYSGETKWERADYPWLNKVTRSVLHGQQLAFETSTFNDHDEGNALHVVSSETGEFAWHKAYPPGMNHARQATAMFLKDDLWILHGGKVNTEDSENRKRIPVQVSALDPATGETRVSHKAGLAHCFPPVATLNYLFSGELDMTDVQTGDVTANRITKANCSRENGWIPANGLIYTTPKHCTCWPMLRGYVAMAPESESAPAEHQGYELLPGILLPETEMLGTTSGDWPTYRGDRWRSGSTTNVGPQALNVLWSARIIPASNTGDRSGPIFHDWNENPHVKSRLSAPVVAYGMAFVSSPDAQEVVGLDATNGDVRWRFTASGRVDSSPTIYNGLCIFGSNDGSVYALRARTGERVWQLRPTSNQRIVAYGQVESPWPVAGAVLLSDDTVYFAAGRQPLASGGIYVHAVDPMEGAIKWAERINTVPQQSFYENSGLEFDPVDILHQEGDGIAMSRWQIAQDGSSKTVDKWNGFARLSTGEGAAWVPRGFWSYGPRHQHRFPGEAARRPLCVFQNNTTISYLNGTTQLFRSDFSEDQQFDSKWITGWKLSQDGRKGKKPYRTDRLAENSVWQSDVFGSEEPALGEQRYNRLHAMALAGDDSLYVMHEDGRLKLINAADGSVVKAAMLPAPAWDGLVISDRKLFVSTQDGQLLCLGE